MLVRGCSPPLMMKTEYSPRSTRPSTGRWRKLCSPCPSRKSPATAGSLCSRPATRSSTLPAVAAGPRSPRLLIGCDPSSSNSPPVPERTRSRPPFNVWLRAPVLAGGRPARTISAAPRCRRFSYPAPPSSTPTGCAVRPTGTPPTPTVRPRSSQWPAPAYVEDSPGPW